jgi:hypothetical protein
MTIAATAANDIHGDESAVEFKLFLAGIGATVALIWYARGERDAILHKIDKLEMLMRGRPCFKDDRCDDLKESDNA